MSGQAAKMDRLRHLIYPHACWLCVLQRGGGRSRQSDAAVGFTLQHRVTNFVAHHPALDGVLRGQALLDIDATHEVQLGY